jgi:hypothetical protein
VVAVAVQLALRIGERSQLHQVAARSEPSGPRGVATSQ